LRVWVDCTAAAHPLVLRPVVELLRERGHEVSITARSYGQTEGLLDLLGLEYESFGSHGGASTLAKGRAVAGRSLALARWARPRRFDLAIAHGSVDVAVVGTLLRIPQAQMQDYEYAGLQRKLAWRAARRVIVPDAIPVDRLRAAGAREDKLVRYPGLKEDYYLAGFEPDPAVLAELDLDRLGVRPDRAADEAILAIVRPPPETSAYHAENPLYDRLLDRLCADPRVATVLIPRTEGQRASALARAEPSLVVPERAVDAQSLIAYSDLVVSAGGTMNREAVALGVPVWTIFSGRMGAVDEELIAAGRLRELADPEALELVKREREPGPVSPRDPAILVDGALAAAR
jgi:predicted glycosyltransferase